MTPHPQQKQANTPEQANDLLNMLLLAEKQAASCKDPLIKHMIRCAQQLLLRERQKE